MHHVDYYYSPKQILKVMALQKSKNKKMYQWFLRGYIIVVKCKILTYIGYTCYLISTDPQNIYFGLQGLREPLQNKTLQSIPAGRLSGKKTEVLSSDDSKAAEVNRNDLSSVPLEPFTDDIGIDVSEIDLVRNVAVIKLREVGDLVVDARIFQIVANQEQVVGLTVISTGRAVLFYPPAEF